VISTLPERPQTSSTSPLPFFHLIERLKTTKREGWRRFSIDHGESISDHMYRMAIITMLCPPSLAKKLDIARCTKMALIHDMAESLVGDITPVDGVSKSEKSRREAETMDYLCAGLLGNVHAGSGQADSIREVWQEYEDSKTPESHFVHDVDKMELLLQMMEYEQSHQGRIDLGEFSRVAKRIVTPEVQEWARELLEERKAFWSKHGKEPSGVLSIDGAGEGVSEERKRQQDEYYGNGTAKAPKLDDAVNGAGSA
jgi:putative hydrolases of HD superfamily